MKLGDSGAKVHDWQAALVARGYQIAIDDVFGKRTHNATLGFQATAALPTTGVVGELEHQAMSLGAIVNMSRPVLPHTIPFVPARHHGPARAAKTVRKIVLHCMEAPESATRAERCASYFAELPSDAPKKKSAHYCIDSDSIVQCVPDHVVAFGAPGANHDGLHFEHAGYARQSTAEWFDAFGTRMLSLSAQLCARKCREHHIPITFLRAGDLRRTGSRGITTHHEVSLAFGRSDHHDPGPGFPWQWYVRHVQFAYDGAANV